MQQTHIHACSNFCQLTLSPIKIIGEILSLVKISYYTVMSDHRNKNMMHCNLILRPSHRQVFNYLQYAKAEGEGLVHFIT